MKDDSEKRRHIAMPLGLVTTCRTILIIGLGRDIIPRIKDAKKFDWHRIAVMWPEIPEEIKALGADDDRVEFYHRIPTEDDVARAHVIIEDCEDRGLAETLAGWARKHNRLINAVDKNELCDLYYMSLIYRDPMILSITSGGDAPSIAVKLRKYLENTVSPGWSTAATLLGDLRNSLPGGQDRRNLLISLASDERLIALIKADDEQGIKDLIEDAIQRIRT